MSNHTGKYMNQLDCERCNILQEMLDKDRKRNDELLKKYPPDKSKQMFDKLLNELNEEQKKTVSYLCNAELVRGLAIASSQAAASHVLVESKILHSVFEKNPHLKPDWYAGDLLNEQPINKEA